MKHDWNTTETRLQHHCNTTETRLKHHCDTTETRLKHHWESTETVLKHQCNSKVLFNLFNYLCILFMNAESSISRAIVDASVTLIDHDGSTSFLQRTAGTKYVGKEFWVRLKCLKKTRRDIGCVNCVVLCAIMILAIVQWKILFFYFTYSCAFFVIVKFHTNLWYMSFSNIGNKEKLSL